MCWFWLPSVAGSGVGGHLSRNSCCLTQQDGDGEERVQKKGEAVNEGKRREMKNWEQMVEEREKDMRNQGVSRSNVSWKAELCDVVGHGLGWHLFLFHVLDLICFRFKRNPMPQFPHLSNEICGVVCPCYSALELSP